MVSIDIIPSYAFKQDKMPQEPSPPYANDEAPGKVKPKKEKVKRTVFTKHQQDTMEGRFREQNFLSKEERIDLARELGLSERHIMIWFQNRRGKLKRRGPQDAAYTTAKFEELCCERPHPILYGMLASLQHKNQLLKPYSAMMDNSVQGNMRNTVQQELRNQTKYQDTQQFHPPNVDARNINGASQWNMPQKTQQLTVNTNACLYSGNTSYPWNNFAAVQKQALYNNGYNYNQTIQNQIPSLSVGVSDMCESPRNISPIGSSDIHQSQHERTSPNGSTSVSDLHESHTQRHISPTGSLASNGSYDAVVKDSSFKPESEQLVPSITNEHQEDYLSMHTQSYKTSSSVIQPMRQNQMSWWENSQCFNDCMYNSDKNDKNELL